MGMTRQSPNAETSHITLPHQAVNLLHFKQHIFMQLASVKRSNGEKRSNARFDHNLTDAPVLFFDTVESLPIYLKSLPLRQRGLETWRIYKRHPNSTAIPLRFSRLLFTPLLSKEEVTHSSSDN